MTEGELQASVLSNYGLRIEAETARYAMEKLPKSREVAVIGTDARTGIPRREILRRENLISNFSES
ncbi:MAG: hypothetical protein ABSF29_09765 [Tepidisphaeraceae bacterium]